MKRLLIDTNIILDLHANREPFYKDAAKLFSLADRGAVKLFISALSVANINYVLLRHGKPVKARQILRKLKLLTGILSLDERIIDLALNDDAFSDFEDALKYYSALENNIDVIINRNLKDFKNVALPVMTAAAFNDTV
ncbi:MAG TPA: PIN domain-containing protein [Bacteroidales bacterium]|nr:PIN domain-containing protein [Bacteroidales bacterium]